MQEESFYNNEKKWLLFNYGLADSEKILAEEENLALEVGEGRVPPLLEVWVASRKCFVLGKNYARKLEKLGKMEKIKEYGIPVVLRSSGGEAILHDSSCLNFTVVVPQKLFPDLTRIDKSFEILSSGIMYSLKEIGIPVYFGKVKTFCPGPYDILVKKRKIAGLSLLMKKEFSLLHGTLFVNTGADYTKELEIFYGPLKNEIISLRILMNKFIKMEDIAKSLIRGYEISFGISFSSFSFQQKS